MTGCTATLQHEDEAVRITRFDFAPGGETGWHVHEVDYVIVPVTDCAMRLELPNGEMAEASFAAGGSYKGQRGTAHNVVNAGAGPMSFVEVELKAAPDGGGPDLTP